MSTTVEMAERSVASRRPPSPGPPAKRRNTWGARLAWPLAAAATAGIACVARYGYTFGTGDHLVLMPRGIADADPGAFAGDWFVERVPQPHWLFDQITEAGAALGALPVVYLLYWLLSLVAFGTAACWVTRRFLPERQWSALLLGPLLVLGPEKVLGSTTPLLGIALPHMLGACLAFLALAALVNRYWAAAILASLAAGVVHLQHGVNLAPVLLLTALLAAGAARQVRVLLVGAAGSLVAGAFLISRWRQIESGGSEWLEVCRTAIPFHCDANSWTVAYLMAGGLVLGLAVVLLVGRRDDWRTLVPTLALPACGLAVAVMADLFDVPVLGQLAQASNAYRLSAAVLPFAALSLMIVVLRLPWRHSLGGVMTAVLMGGWCLAADASLDLGSGTDVLRHTMLVVTITAALAVLARTPSAGRAVAVAVAMIAAPVVGLDGKIPLAVGYWRGDPLVAAALDLRSALPEGSVVATSPGLLLPTIAQRAVIADCKRVPYGGQLWREYRDRLAALGGGCFGSAGGFSDLSVPDVLGLADRYGATHVLLRGTDPKLGHAREHWELGWRRQGAGAVVLTEGLWLFELPRS